MTDVARYHADVASEERAGAFVKYADYAELRTECNALRAGYAYLQDRLESLGYSAWAHDRDAEIAESKANKFNDPLAVEGERG